MAADLSHDERQGESEEHQGAILSSDSRAAKGHGKIQESSFSGLSETPDGGYQAKDHGGKEVLHKERAGDKLDHRSSRKRSGEQETGGGRDPAARGAVEQSHDRQKHGEIEDPGRILAAQKIEDGVGPIGAHRHDRPEEAGRADK